MCTFHYHLLFLSFSSCTYLCRYIGKDGKDYGINVTTKAKKLVDLLEDMDSIKEERAKSRANKEKYSGVDSTTMRRSRYSYHEADSNGNMTF